jgi:serine O-acetyltransferase
MSPSLAQFLHTQRASQGHLTLNVLQLRQMADEIMALLYPQIGKIKLHSVHEAQAHVDYLKRHLVEAINALSSLKPSLSSQAEELTETFLQALPGLAQLMDKDAQAAFQGDPAAYSVEEVILTYPGFYAIAIHRLAHQLHQQGIPLLPRLLSEYAHERTGIDIHPGAQIGESFFIDHGTGVVIGETTVIGKNVKIYQGVTLGALSVKKKLQSVKRHPTIEDGVIIYANSTILGGETVIGADSVIGGNVWLTESVEKKSRIFYPQNSSH